MSSVIGIDLGTTNTVVSIVRDGQASALADEAGHTLIPSVVSFHPNGNVLVGRAAKERRIVDASSTVYSIKRLIGRSWDSEEVRRARSRFPFEMREGPGQAALVVARGETYTLPEISAFVLRKAKSVAEAALGVSIDRAVITVPANFNDLQRAATKVAGRVAGLEVMRILNEPTAAALAYGYGRSSSERIAVYDFGGGTFDVTLLDLSNNVFEVLATAGNTFLGGDDLDLAIAERMSEVLLAQHRLDARADSQVFERLRAAAETVKHQLSTDNEARVTVNEVGHGAGGKPVNFEFSMTRGEVERLATPIVDRTFDVCREALGIARLSVNAFDQILLVGGSTRIPLVRKRVEEFFRKPMRANINPDEVVAIGAAIQAAALSGAEKRRSNIPPAPSPAARQTHPSFSDAPNQAAGAARKRQSTQPPGQRPRMESSPGIPSTQPFFGRPHMATQPGLAPGSAPPRERMPSMNNESTLGALGRAPSNAPLANTLGGLGSRGRTKTGPGLGPDAGRVVSGPTLVSASEEALRAREAMNDALGLPLVGAQSPPKPALDAGQIAQKYGNLPLVAAKGAAKREESVAVSLGDGDFEELESAPIQPGLHGAAALGALAPQPVQLDDEDALPLPEVPEEDDEITRVGVPRDAVPRQEAPRAAPAPPAARPVNPFAGAALLGGSTQQTPHTQAPQTPLLQPPTPPAPLPAQPAPPIPPGYATQQLAAAFAPPRTAPMQQAAPTPTPFGMLETPGLPPPAFGGFEPVPAQRSAPPPPLLIDVTPLTLAVETVNGFCDAIIERNTQVPCERTRVFVTAADNQTFVRVRISQGESSRFGENTLLGEVELGGLHPARRGEVQIALSFSLDTNGMLNVSAKEVATGRATSVLVRLIALPDASDIAWMTQRNAARQI
jgi:molecular chaperone DnaK